MDIMFWVSVSPLFILLGVLAWVVFWDSKKRWPDKGWFTRYAYIITFKR